MASFVQKAKSDLRDYQLASLFTAVFLGVLAGSDSPNQIATIHYETQLPSIRDTNLYNRHFYDVLSLAPLTGSSPNVNVPVPLIDRLFIRSLREKFSSGSGVSGFSPKSKPSHRRSYTDDLEKVRNSTRTVYEKLAEISRRLPMEKVVEIVFGNYCDRTRDEFAVDMESLRSLARTFTLLAHDPKELDAYIAKHQKLLK